jgi:hypothetical protein
MTGRPSAAARAWDAAALALVAAGAAVVYYAHQGLEGIRRSPLRAAAHGSPNVARWVHYRTVSNVGFAMIVAGVVIGVVAWYRSRREQMLARALPVPLDDAPLAVSPSVVPAVPPDVPPNAPPG